MAYLVEITPGMRFECVTEAGLDCHPEDDVIVKFEKYEDWGVVVRTLGEGAENVDGRAAEGHAGRESADKGGRGNGARNGSERKGRSAQGSETPTIVRLMTPADRNRAVDVNSRAESMFKTAQRKIREHHLAMKLVSCHYAFDKSIAFFHFSAEGRVDFRNLVRDLSGALHTRVELRQIGVRDEAGIVGGIGPCGRVFCCASVLDRFHSVNVKMAKIQRLSLNPASVSGGCGRLKCCLRYEVDGYKEMCRHLPRNGARCETPDGPGRVMDCNALTQRVRVRLEGDSAQFKDFQVEEIRPLSKSGSDDGKNPGRRRGERKGQSGREAGRKTTPADGRENAQQSDKGPQTDGEDRQAKNGENAT